MEKSTPQEVIERIEFWRVKFENGTDKEEYGIQLSHSKISRNVSNKPSNKKKKPSNDEKPKKKKINVSKKKKKLLKKPNSKMKMWLQ